MNQRTIYLTIAMLVSCFAWGALRAETEPDITPAKEDAKETIQSPDWNEAVEKFKERDFEGTLESLRKAVEKNKDLPPAQVLLADLFARTNNAMGMRNALEQAVAEMPNDPEAYLIMGEVAFSERSFTAAKLLFLKAWDISSKFTGSEKRKKSAQLRILGGLASINEVEGNWANAQKNLESCLKIEPQNLAATQRLAGALFQQKNPDGAIQKLREAAKINPEMPAPEAIMGQLYQTAKDSENAAKWMALAVKETPKDIKTHLIVGQWALEIGQYDEAEKRGANALQIDPKSLDAKLLCGRVALFKKDFATAETYFQQAVLDEPNYFPASNLLAFVLAEQNDPAKQQKAFKYAQANVQKDSKNAEAVSAYAHACYRLGQFKEAEKAFQMAVSSGPVTPDTAYFYASMLADRAQDTDAIKLLDIALKSPDLFVMRQEAEAMMEKLNK